MCPAIVAWGGGGLGSATNYPTVIHSLELCLGLEFVDDSMVEIALSGAECALLM